METFKQHSYPDVLVSVLLTTFKEFRKWCDGVAVKSASKKSFWLNLIDRFPVAKPLKKQEIAELKERLVEAIDELEQILHAADSSDRKSEASTSKNRIDKSGAGIEVGASAVKAELGLSQEDTLAENRSVVDEYRHEKLASLHRNIIKYRELTKLIGSIGDSKGYVLLDDLYHIKSEDQVNVVDYFHRILKGTDCWLKIGTIRHRTKYYMPGSPPMGMKIGDDCEEIDLDVTLEKYQLTKKFLMRILDQFARDSEINLNAVITDGARDRLVIGSGGVARDFLSIFRRSVEIARERVAAGQTSRGDKVGAEDVNKAAGENDSYKQTEFKRDAAAGDQEELQEFFKRVITFCVEINKTNCFLIRKDLAGSDADNVAELVDLKLLHHCNSRVTVRSKVGQIYEAFMLDIAQYTADRARRNLDIIEFWNVKGEKKLRRSSIIFSE